MARGMANNEGITSQANTKQYDEGYERVFGANRKPMRGRWVINEEGELVDANDYTPPSRALDAPIMAGRFYENVSSTDGVDIGSRKKHREYMKQRDLAPADDYSAAWYERRRKEKKRDQDRERKEALKQAAYKLWKP